MRPGSIALSALPGLLLMVSTAARAQTDAEPRASMGESPDTVVMSQPPPPPPAVCELRIIPVALAQSDYGSLVDELISSNRKGRYRRALSETLRPERQVALLSGATQLANLPVLTTPLGFPAFGTADPPRLACHGELRVDRIAFVSNASWSELQVRYSFWGVRDATSAPYRATRTVASRIFLADGTDERSLALIRADLEIALQRTFVAFCMNLARR